MFYKTTRIRTTGITHLASFLFSFFFKNIEITENTNSDNRTIFRKHKNEVLGVFKILNHTSTILRS